MIQPILMKTIYIVVPRGCGRDYVNGMTVTKKNCLSPWNTKIHCLETIDLYKKGLIENNDVIYCPGGIFQPPEYQTVPISRLMSEYLLKSGIRADKVILEEKSVTTRGMVINLAETLMLNNLDVFQYKIRPIAHVLHNMKIRLMLKRCGYKKIYPINLYYKISFKDFVHDILTFVAALIDKNGKLTVYTKEEERRRLRKNSIWS